VKSDTVFSGPYIIKVVLLTFWSQCRTESVDWQWQQVERCDRKRI